MSDYTATLTGGYGSTAVFRCGGILEIDAADRESLVEKLSINRKPIPIPERLEDSIFAGHAVLDVSLPTVPDDPCRVPHFGHSVNCEQDVCDGPGIFRLFNLSFIVTATLTMSLTANTTSPLIFK